MNTHQQPTHDPAVVAVLHPHSGRCFGLIASTADSTPRVLDTRVFTGPGDIAINAWLDERKASRVLLVLPASSIICRTVTLPAASAEQLDQALRLQAEAHLLGIAPPHRQAMAMLPAAVGETTRAGLVLAWPESRTAVLPATDRPLTIAGDVAALAALCNSHRPAPPLFWLDPSSNALALALAHAGGVVFRAMNEDLSSADERQAAIRRTLAESALNAGHTGAFVQSIVAQAQASAASAGDNALLSLPDEVRAASIARLAGASEDREWWSQFGIAAGAVLAMTGELAPLTAMLASVPVATPSRISEVVGRLSNRRIAMAAALTCILVLIFGPMIVHGLRLAVLSLRYSDVDRDRRLVEALEDQHKMYMELHERGWSVTKTLSDIACNTPLDIEVDLIRITAADRGFVMMGKALGRASENLTARDNVVLMQKNLHDTGMFKDVTFTIEKGDFSGRYNFDLSARIDRPFHPFDYANKAKERDFAVWTHLDRLMGKSLEDVTEAARLADASAEAGAEPAELIAAADSETGAPDSTTSQSDAEPSEPNGRSGSSPTRLSSRPGPLTGRSPGASTGEEPGTFSDIADRPVTNAPVTVPAAITQAQVDAMSQEEVKSALSNVSKARQLASLSDEDKERLKNEFNMLLKRLRSF